MFGRVRRRIVGKKIKYVEEIKFYNFFDLKNIFVELVNKYGKCIENKNIMFRKEKDDFYSIVIVNVNYFVIFYYFKRLEVMRFRCRYGYYNRFGVS